MGTRPKLALACLAGLAACGGSSSSSAGPGVNRYTGTITITSALPGGTTSCGSTQTVTFRPAGAGVDTFTVTVAGGDCVRFLNSDASPHQPAPRAPNTCAELEGSTSLTTGQSFTTKPLAVGAPKPCDWMDSLNPPGSGGGGY